MLGIRFVFEGKSYVAFEAEAGVMVEPANLASWCRALESGIVDFDTGIAMCSAEEHAWWETNIEAIRAGFAKCEVAA